MTGRPSSATQVSPHLLPTTRELKIFMGVIFLNGSILAKAAEMLLQWYLTSKVPSKEENLSLGL